MAEPYLNPYNRDMNSNDISEHSDVLLERIKKDLIDLAKDLELNYSRISWKNPMINITLKMISRVLREFAEMLDMPDYLERTSSDNDVKTSKFSFGTTKESIK